MKQWLGRRGVLTIVPVAALVVFALDACSSEPGSGPTEASKPTVPEAKQTQAEEEIAPSVTARSRLASLAQFTRIVRVSKHDITTQPGARFPAKSQPALQATARPIQKPELQEELRAVLSPGEAEHFFKRGEHIRAEVSTRLKNEAVRPATVDLPQTADGFVRIQSDASKVGVEFAAKDVKGVPFETADGLVSYPGAASGGGDMVLRIGRETVEDFVVLTAKPEHPFVDYRVKVSEIAGLRLYDNTLEFLSKDGNPEVRVSPPDLVDAKGISHPAKLELLDCAFDASAAAPWDRPVTAPGANECSLRVSWDDARVTYPAIVDPVWSSGGTLAKARYRNAAAKMSNGNVITCGGLDINGDPLASCEIYSPGTNTWATGPALKTPRNLFSLIAVGTDVLAVGDQTSATSELCNCTSATPAWTATATNFSTGSFSLTQLEPVLTGDLANVVLVDYYGKPFKYSVAAKTWTAGTSNTIFRQSYSVLAVPGGTAVLRCGGSDNGGLSLKTCEKYTPATDVWIMPGAAGAAANTNAGRSNPAWATIDSTHVMLYGGYNAQTGTNIPSAEIYNGGANTWTDIGAIPSGFSEYELHNTWAIHGGTNKIFSGAYYNPWIYDPAAFSWTQLSTYDGVSSFQLMYNGEGAIASAGSKVLIVPVSTGNGGNSAQATCKLFDFVAQGGTCQQTADCKSGLTCYYDNQTYTADGLSVCCDTTCTDACSSCRAVNKESGTGDGTCGPRLHDQYLYTNACPGESYTTCGNVGNVCDGKGACKKYDSSTVCAYQSCADGDTQNNQRNCDGNGTCAALTTTDCAAGYNCLYNQCSSQCYDDSYCAGTYYCQYWSVPLATQNTCQPRKANGKACSNNSTSECTSGNCVDGFCCDTACNGTCEACSNALTTKTNGVCSAIPNGQSSGNDCKDAGAASCGQNGVCNGAKACQKYAAGTQCGDIAVCASETSRFVPDQCDGTGTCTDKGTQACNVGYSCQAGVCNTTCTVDANCASTYFCDTATNACVADHKQGQTCKSDRQCEGNVNCIDGVCCDSACTGTCRSCLKNRTGLASDGVCGNTLDDTDPENECAIDVGYPASCKAPGTCDGAGACRVYAKAGTVAKANVCNTITLTQTSCDGAGNLDPRDTPCYPYKCNAGGTACRVGCTTGTAAQDCDDSSFCGPGGTCVGQKQNGAECRDNTECKSQHCANIGKEAQPEDTGAGGAGAGGAPGDVDTSDAPGVCCDSDCGNPCEACKKSIKGEGTDGTCGPVKDHTDPAGDCPVDPVNPCGHNGQCDGDRHCRNVPGGTACGVTSCVGNAVQGQRCDGLGACINNDGTTACAPYVCRDVSGAQQCTNPCADDNDCADGYFCSEMACKKKLANGKECASSAICNSGFCVDGLCCDVSCNGQCEACDSAGNEGICTPVTGDPHGNRVQCEHAGEECGGACDGVNASACKYSPNGTSCGTPTCDNDLATSSSCNGQGECKANKNTECSPYVCGTDDVCLERCEQDADCSQGYACDETTQRCLPSAVAATCSEDRLTSQGQNGANTPCKPFLCVPASGTCAVSCAFTTDCSPDFVCEPSTKTCLPAPPDSGDADDGSCACRAVGAAPTSSGSNYLTLAALGALLTGLRRRKRSRKPTPTPAKPRGFASASQPSE
jgi:hypothetical protein